MKPSSDLLRPLNVFTAVADTLAGLALGFGGLAAVPAHGFWLLGASALLYLGAAALNDYRGRHAALGMAVGLLALLRNEINLDSQTTPIFEQSVRPTMKDGRVVPLFAQGLAQDIDFRDQFAQRVVRAGAARARREISFADSR